MKLISITCLAVILLLTSGCTINTVVDVSSPPSNQLTGSHCKLQRDLHNQEQQTDFWCWAASAHTVIEYLRQEPINQCSLVDAVFRHQEDEKWSKQPPSSLPPPNCCMSTGEFAVVSTQPNVQIATSVCRDNGWPEYVFNTEEYRMRFNGYISDGLSWDEIVQEICEDRPMIAAIAFSEAVGGGAHTVVIGGYSELEDGSQWVHIYDPGFNTLEGDYYLWPYDVYRGNTRLFTHVRDYKNISLP